MAELRKKVLTQQSGGAIGRKVGSVSVVGWSNYYDKREILKSGFCVYSAGTSGPILFFIHGAGLNALSWAVLVGTLKQKYRIYALDCRNHGDTTLNSDDMSYTSLVNDVKTVLQELFPDDLPKLVLIGHSMGGSIAIRTALELPKEKLLALIVLDVVEGTALAALPNMLNLLKARPQMFQSQEAAIQWAVSTGNPKNKESACVSVPPQVVEKDGYYTWRTDLEKTAPFWKEWFENMSELFLSVPVPKMLMLADTDRLDKSLTIAQMQGKFLMAIVPMVGHLIHEDSPPKAAVFITSFLERFRIT